MDRIDGSKDVIKASGTESVHPKAVELHLMQPSEVVELMISELDLRPSQGMSVGPLEAASDSIKKVIGCFNINTRIIYIGAGTSGRLAVADAAEIEPTSGMLGRVYAIHAGGSKTIENANEALEDNPNGAIDSLAGLRLTPDDVVIGFTACGRTPFVLGALSWVSSLAQAPKTVLVANNPISKISAAELLVELGTGSEVVAGSTRLRAAQAQRALMCLLSTTLMQIIGRFYQGRMIGCKGANASGKLHKRAEVNVAAICGVSLQSARESIEMASGFQPAALLIQMFDISAEEAFEVFRKHRGHFENSRRALAEERK